MCTKSCDLCSGCFLGSAARPQNQCCLVLLCGPLLSPINSVKMIKNVKKGPCECFEEILTIKNGFSGHDLPLKPITFNIIQLKIYY